MPNTDAPRCSPAQPLSIVLGAGAVRGMAHIGVIEVLQDAGFRITEMVGTSVGALIAGFYGVVGRDMRWIREMGLSVRSSHLLTWAFIRRFPPGLRRRYGHFAGAIPQHVEELARTPFDRTHHGVTSVGIVSYDLLSKQQVVVHNHAPILRLEDAVRGAIAVPGLFPSWTCTSGGTSYELVDGGTRQRVPVGVVFEAPFRPAQVVMVDVSNKPLHRQASLASMHDLRERFPHIPLDCICVDTLEGRSIVYRHSHAMRLLESGRSAARDYVAALDRGRPAADRAAAGGEGLPIAAASA